MVCPCSVATLGRRGDDQAMGRGGGRCREGRWPGVEPGEEGRHVWRWGGEMRGERGVERTEGEVVMSTGWGAEGGVSGGNAFAFLRIKGKGPD
jgi:hypothetical protein